jgi:predicted metal-dependent hydrolase
MTLNREIYFGSSETLLLEISTLTRWSGRRTNFLKGCQQLSEEHRRLLEYTVQAELSGFESEFRL